MVECCSVREKLFVINAGGVKVEKHSPRRVCGEKDYSGMEDQEQNIRSSNHDFMASQGAQRAQISLGR